MFDLWLKVKTIDLIGGLICGGIFLLVFAIVALRDHLAAWRIRRWNRKADKMHYWPHRKRGP